MREHEAQKLESKNGAHPLLVQRKCACGGSAKLSGSCSNCEKEKLTGVQAKLKIGAANDCYEQEADRVADQLMRSPSPSPVTPTALKISRYANSDVAAAGSAPASVERTLTSSGRPLDTLVRRDMEQRFGHDFSNVRIHTSASAARSASDIQARAYTAGNNIVFNSGEYAPQNSAGKKLLAHELTHTIQQSNGRDNIYQSAIQRATYENCSTPERESITEAAFTVFHDLRNAIRVLEQQPDSAVVNNSFWLAFRVANPSEAQKQDLLGKLRVVKEGLRNVNYICDHGEEESSLCNRNALGHSSIGSHGNGISLCFSPPDTRTDNDFFFRTFQDRSQTMIHEATHYFLSTTDAGGYFGGIECNEVPIDTPCLENPDYDPNDSSSGPRYERLDCGTSGRPPNIRLATADAYSCFVYFLGALAATAASIRRIDDRADAYRGENLSINSHVPGDLLGSERILNHVLYINSSERSEIFQMQGVPVASGFRYLWQIEYGGVHMPLRRLSYMNRPSAYASVDVKDQIRRLQAAGGPNTATITCLVRLFTGASDSTRLEIRLPVSISRTDPTESELG